MDVGSACTSTLASVFAQLNYITRNCKRCPEKEIIDILGIASLDPFLLEGYTLTPSPERYARHHIHGGERFSFLAIVWLPGQASPIHSHKTWCAMCVYRGMLTETLYCRDAIGVDLTSQKYLFSGAVSHLPYDKSIAHKMHNTTTRPALSLHVYGAPFDRLGHDVNQLWSLDD